MKKKIVIFLIIAALGAGGTIFFTGAGKNNVENSGMKSVVVKPVTKGTLLQTVTAEGEVEITNEEDIFVSKSIRVDEVFFEENDTVEKGEKLITFDAEQRNELIREIEATELKIEEEKLNIEENKFEVSTLSIENAERDIEELNTEISKYGEKIRIAQLEKETLQKELENNVEEYEINKQLFELEGISFTELNSSEEAKDSSIKDIEAKEWEIEEYKLDLAESMQKLVLAQKTLADAQKTYEEDVLTNANNIKRAEIAIRQYELEIETYKEDLEKTVEYVVSPVSGTITEVSAEKNFLVDTSESLMTISDINSQVITANISSYDINDVEIGQKVKITSDSFDEGESITGKVDKISSLATTESGSGYEDIVVEVEISFDSATSNLRPGYSVDLEIVTTTKADTITVPSFAVNKNKAGKSYVMVLNSDNTVSTKVVKTGIETTKQIEILNLSGDEKIVMNGTNLTDGEKVTVVDRMTSKVGERKQGGGGGNGPRP